MRQAVENCSSRLWNNDCCGLYALPSNIKAEFDTTTLYSVKGLTELLVVSVGKLCSKKGSGCKLACVRLSLTFSHGRGELNITRPIHWHL